MATAGGAQFTRDTLAADLCQSHTPNAAAVAGEIPADIAESLRNRKVGIEPVLAREKWAYGSARGTGSSPCPYDNRAFPPSPATTNGTRVEVVVLLHCEGVSQ